MRLGGIYVDVRADTDQYKRDLAKAKTLTEKNVVYLQNKFDSINFKALGVTALAFSATVAYGMKQAITAASNLEETVGKFNVVFATQKKEAEAMAKVLVNSYAMSTREAKQYMSSVQDLLVPMGMAADKALKMSNEVVKLSADLASFNNTTTAQVMMDIQSALVGNFETMKKYGVVLNETVIKQEAYRQGLWNGKGMVDANTKAQIAYTLMLKGSAAAIGDQQRTMGSYANQMKQLTASTEDLKAMMGNELLPVATDVVNKINEWIKANDGLIKQKTHDTINSISESIKSIASVYNSLPDGVVGAAGAGIIGKILFGGTAGKTIAILVFLDDVLGKLDLSISDIVKKHNAAGDSIIKLYKSIVDAIGGDDGTLIFPMPEYTQKQYDQMQLAINQIKEYEKSLKSINEVNNNSVKITAAELKALQDANIEKYKMEIALAEQVKKDTWLIREEGYKKAVEQAEDYITWKTENDYEKEQNSLKKLADLQEKAIKEANEAQIKAYEHMYDEIHDIMADFWEGILDGQMSSWDDFMDHMLNTFKKTFAQILADATTPILLNLVSGVLGGGGSGGGSGILGKIGDKLGTGILNKLSTSPVFGSLFNSVPSGSFALASGVPGSMATAGNAAWSAGIGGGGLSGTLGGGGLSAGASWPSMLTGAAGIGVIAAAGMIATKVLGRMFSEKPQFGISGMAKEDWIFGTGSNGPGTDYYTIAMENMYDDFKSSLYDYRVFAADFDDEPKIRQILFDYFDTVFASIDSAISTDINDILQEYQHLGVSFRVTDDMNFEQAFAGLSDAVFSELLGSLLLSALPGSGAIEKTIKTITGSQYVTAGSVLDKSAPQIGSREYYDSAGFSSQAKGTGADPYLYTEPVYEDIKHQVSAMADVFNVAFFDAIMPEGSTSWDGFLFFADTVQKTDDFMDKFNDRMTDFNLTAVDAFGQIAFVSAAIADLDAIAESFDLDPTALAIKNLVIGFETLITALKENNATVDELAAANKAMEKTFWETVIDLSSGAIGTINAMSDAVKGFVWSSDQIKMQKIAGQAESVVSFFDDIYDAVAASGNAEFTAVAKALKDGIGVIVTTLTAVQALDIFKGHMQTIGGMKAGIYGLEDEWAAMNIGSKYGAQLGSAQEQAAFVKSVLGMSATEFITATEDFGVSVEEAAGDMLILTNIVKETSKAFENIGDSVNDAIKSLKSEFGTGSTSSLTNMIKQFSKFSGDALSSNSLIATAGSSGMINLAPAILQKALAEAPTAYEYNKVYAKIIRGLEDVEDAAGDQVDALSLTDITLNEQLTELGNINTAIGLVDKSIDSLLSESTFVVAYSAFNQIWNNGLVFDNLNSTLISLTGALSDLAAKMGIAIPEIIPDSSNIVTDPVTGSTGTPGTYFYSGTGGTTITTLDEASILSKYGIVGTDKAIIQSSIADWDKAGIDVKWDVAQALGVTPYELQADMNKLKQSYGYEDGGISSGPKSGYMAKLHGTEAIIPLGNGDLSLVIKNDYSKGILTEITGLRSELKEASAINSLKIKKIEKTLKKVTGGLDSIKTRTT